MTGPLLLDPSDVDVDFKRDRWGRPHIMQPDGTRVGYTRCSSAAKTIEDTFNLEKWARRNVAYGLAYDASLVARILAIGGDPSTWEKPAKDAVNQIVTDAEAVAKAHKAADIGTAIHKLTERMDRGETVVGGPYQADLDAYRAAIDAAGFAVKEVECRMVNDELLMAGTCDRIVYYWRPGQRTQGYYIADVKTSATVDFGGLGWAAQLAAYAGGQLYDVTLEQRVHTPTIDPAVGYIIHLPAGQGVCTIHEVDLVAGLAAAKLANQIREIRKASKKWIRPMSTAVHAAVPTIHPGDNVTFDFVAGEVKVDHYAGTTYEGVTDRGAPDQPPTAACRRTLLLARYEALTHDQKAEFKTRRTKGDLDAVEKALDDIEHPPTMRETQAAVAQLKTPQKAKNPKPDEGPDVAAADWEPLGVAYKALPEAAQLWCARLLGEAKNGGVPIHRTNAPTLRRYEIYRGLIKLAGWIGDECDDPTRTGPILVGLVHVANDGTPSDVTPGHALGLLDHTQAATFSQLVDQLVDGGTEAA